MTAAGISGTSAERRIGTIAAEQHGVVTRAQLLRAGVSPDVVDRRLGSGWLRPLERGVYVVGPVIAPRAAEMAAALACGEGAVVSHRSAAVIWQLLPAVADPGPVHVTVTRGHPRPRAKVHAHRVGTLGANEVTSRDRIPVTTPARTLYDLAGSTPRRDVESALTQALAQGLTSVSQVAEPLTRHAGRRGARRLRGLLEDGAPAPTRSAAERRFLGLLRRVELPPPKVNVAVEVTRWTSFGRPSGSSWRWMGSRITRRARRSRTTADAMRCSRRPGCTCCA